MTSQNSQHHQNLAVLREIVEDEFSRQSSSVTDLEMLDAVRPRYDQNLDSTGDLIRVHLNPMWLISDHVATFIVRNSDETFTAFILSEIIIDALPGGHVKVWGFQVLWDDDYEKTIKVWDLCSNLDDLRRKRLNLPHESDKWDLYQLAQQVWSICHQIAEILEVDEYTLEEDIPSIINRILQCVLLVHIGEAKVEKERLIVTDRESSGLELTDRMSRRPCKQQVFGCMRAAFWGSVTHPSSGPPVTPTSGSVSALSMLEGSWRSGSMTPRRFATRRRC